LNRQARRNQGRELKKTTQTINSLTPAQARIMESITDEKALKKSNKYIEEFGMLMDRSLTAALIDYGIEYEDINSISDNLSTLLLEDYEKIDKLEGENTNMTTIEVLVKKEVEELLEKGDNKKQNIETLIYKFPKLSKSMLLNAYGKVRKEQGLTENRISKGIVYEEFDKNAISLNSKEMVARAMKKFGFTENTAKTYYSKWKKAYMVEKTGNDPIFPDTPASTKDVKVKKVEATTKKVEENAKNIIEVVKERQCVKPTEIDNVVQASKMIQVPTIKKTEVVEMKKLLVVEEKVIKTIKVIGENGAYEAETNKGVSLSNEGMSMSFNTLEELEKFYEEFREVFSLVG